MPDPEKGISVIICCYNSAERLPETIRHLALQDFKAPWEVIVVNNNSSDDTGRTAQSEWEKYGVQTAAFKIVDETRPGLNHARQRGAAEAGYEYLLFCDDDNWLQSDFLSVAFSLISNDRSIGAVGGECIAVSDGNDAFPDWFDRVKNNYAVGKQADRTGDVTARGYLWGAGLMTTKTIFHQCVRNDFPFILTDRKGSLLSSGGDTELCSRIILCGYKLWYDERLKLKHFVPANRLTRDYCGKLIEGIDAAHPQLSKYYHLIRIRALGKRARIASALKSLGKIMLSRLVNRWDTARDKQIFYMCTGVDMGVDEDVKLLKRFQHGTGKPAR